jgi:alkylhydroperoxidase/carboxymuconolactone decarboxylase family protein YurZ
VLTYLYEQRHITASGHETTDTDPGLATSKDDYSLESYILGINHYQIEMLANLDQVPEAGALVMISFPSQKAVRDFRPRRRHRSGSLTMPKPIEYEASTGEVRAVYDDIRATRKTDFINNFWKVIAHHPSTLSRIWDSLKRVMVRPSSIDPLTKEMIYIAVSVTTIASTASPRTAQQRGRKG